MSNRTRKTKNNINLLAYTDIKQIENITSQYVNINPVWK